MTDLAMGPSWRVHRTALGDGALTVLCVVLVEIAVWSGTIRGSQAANSVLLGVVAATVAVRTTAPLRAAGIASAVLAVQVGLYGATETAGLTIAVLALSYSVAAHTEGRRLVTGLAGVTAAGLFHEARDPDIHTFVDALFVPIVIAVAAALGFAAAQVRARAELAERNSRMAAAAQGTAALLAAGQERERIARELHDVLAHSMSVMVVQAEAAEELLDRSPGRARGPVQAVQRTGREALTELRTLLGAMREDETPDLAPQPGIGQLSDLVEAAVEAGQQVHLTIEGRLPTVPPVIGTTIYRIVQEGLTNARKHAPGAACRIDIHAADERVRIDIDNDPGRGAPYDAAGAGHGLVGMRERVELSGGTLVAGPRPDGGFAVRAELPVRHP
ncbi:MAG: sensor histidine kinase [Marmoricola sp.]